jgi:uncharacterized membrane protein
MSELLFGLAFLAALGSGIMAGVFFAFSVFVMRALARLPAEQGIAAMQAINAAVITPLFMTVFLGTAALSAVLIAAGLGSGEDDSGLMMAAGAVCYLTGCLFLTLRCNVPRNNRLAALDPASEAAAGYWRDYLRSWTRWNHVRTFACLAAAAFFIWANGF